MYIRCSYYWFLCQQIAKDAKEARIREMEARLSELELEKVKLVHTGTERLHALNAVNLEKEQLRKELQASRSTVAGLAGREPPLAQPQ